MFGANPQATEVDDENRVDSFAVTTGNSMNGQLQPWHSGVFVSSFGFSYWIRMPNMYHYAKSDRHGRPDDAPRVWPPSWVRIMGRRIEAQLARVWQFGFVSWN